MRLLKQLDRKQSKKRRAKTLNSRLNLTSMMRCLKKFKNLPKLSLHKTQSKRSHLLRLNVKKQLKREWRHSNRKCNKQKIIYRKMSPKMKNHRFPRSIKKMQLIIEPKPCNRNSAAKKFKLSMMLSLLNSCCLLMNRV